MTGLRLHSGNSPVSINSGPLSSPVVIQFGSDGSVFEVTITFHDDTRTLINVRLSRNSVAAESTLLINDVEVGTVNPGGALLVSASKLASLGLETFEDIGSIGLRG